MAYTEAEAAVATARLKAAGVSTKSSVARFGISNKFGLELAEGLDTDAPEALVENLPVTRSSVAQMTLTTVLAEEILEALDGVSDL